LRNDGVLPLERGLRRVALIGPNARWLETGGGGSSAVTPLQDRSLLDELTDRLSDPGMGAGVGTEVVHEEGCRVGLGLPRIAPHLLVGGELRLEYFDNPGFGGEPVAGAVLRRSRLFAGGARVAGVPVQDLAVRASATFVPDQDGAWQLGVESAGSSRVLLDGEVVLDNSEPVPSKGSFYGYGSEPVTADVELAAGRSYELVLELRAEGRRICGFELRAASVLRPDARERAVAAAREADVAVVVVGANSQLETEGADRSDLRLFGEQDELVRAVAAVNPRTVVVLNGGGPVEMPWIDDVAATVCVWYPGEEGAGALVDVLTGVADPGGRLPVTFPRRLEDGATHFGDAAPARYPGIDGKVAYGEGLLVGYRHFDEHGVEPLFPFGHGLSYTTFEWGSPVVDGTAPGDVTVQVPVTNTGDRPGTDVVQLYVGRPTPDASAADVALSISSDDDPVQSESGVDTGVAAGRAPVRPVRQLAGFAKVTVEPGGTETAIVHLDERAFRRWDEPTRTWTVDPGQYELTVAASSRDLRHTVRVTAPAP
jgi:beta-glucosidase